MLTISERLEIHHNVFLHVEGNHFNKNNIIYNSKFGSNNILRIQPLHIGLDLLRGFLLLCVITYHARNESMHSDPLTYWIITLVMPQFMALSGYLINEDFIKKASFFDLLKKYWKRMGRDWLIVVTLMYIIDILMDIRVFSFKDLIFFFIFPQYHLWYIPALFLSVVMFWILKKLKINDNAILVISLTFSMTYGDLADHFNAVDRLWDFSQHPYNISFALFDSIRLFFFGFFVVGWYTRKYIVEQKIPHRHFGHFLAIMGLVITLTSRIIHSLGFTRFYTVNFFLLNYSLTVMFIPIIRHLCLHKNLVINQFLQFISDYSLYIYLYHGLFVYLRYI